jgi:hypothetical protein
LGNRKGQLTPRLNEYISKSISASCSPAVEASVKDHVIQRSKQVKTAIKTSKGKKSFDRFGQAELATYSGLKSDIGPLKIQDLTIWNPLSCFMNSASLNNHVGRYHMHRLNTTDLEGHAENLLSGIVNPPDEE